MPATRILFFDGTQVSVLLWQAGKVEAQDRFEATPVGFEGLANLLAQSRNTPVMLLADIAEEGFQLENIPRLQGGDRKALITRRLGQYFYGTPFTAAMSLGRETTGRRDERIQFAALTRPEMLTPWLDVLREAYIPLRGIYSVPLVLSSKKPAFATAERFILVTVSQGGLRQTFFDKGQMHFSRLSQLTNPRPESIGQVCSRETAKTVQYLLGQRQITRGTRLPVYVLAHPDEHVGIHAHCPDTTDVSFEFVDLAAFAKECGYKGGLSSSFADPVLAHCLAAKPPAEQFAPDTERRTYRLWQVRFALRSMALMFVVTGMLWAGKQMLDVQSLNDSTELLRASTRADEQRYTGILGGLPQVSVTPANLRALLARYDELIESSPESKPALQHLGVTLQDFPGIELAQLQWKVSSSPETTGKVSPGGTAGAPPGAPPTAVAAAALAGNSAKAWIVLDIHGTLPLSLTGNQRGQIEMVNQLSSQLQRDGVRTRIVKMPVDIQSDTSLRSDSNEGTNSPEGLRFAIRLDIPMLKPTSAGLPQ